MKSLTPVSRPMPAKYPATGHPPLPTLSRPTACLQGRRALSAGWSLFLAAVCAWLMLSVSSRAAERGVVTLQGGETPEQIQAAYTQAIQALAPELGFGPNSQAALRRFEATLHHAARPGAEAERLACCRAVAVVLQSDAAAHAKYWMLQAIQFVGQEEVVPAVTTLLNGADPLLREAARCALQHNPAPAAAEALRAALTSANEPAWQAALALALGNRQDAPSVPLLAKLLNSQDEGVLSAALFALGRIGNTNAAQVLVAAQATVPVKLRAEAAEAQMKCAERLLREGQTAQAAAIYRQCSQPDLPRPVRLAAQLGALRASGDAAASRVLAMLTSDDADTRALALGFVPELGPVGLRFLALGLGQLPAAAQIQLLGLLAELGEKSALPAARRLAKDADESARQAGLLALGRLGDAASVSLLVEALHSGGSLAGTARQSLTQLNAEGVNEALVGAMQRENDPARRATLIEVLEARGANAAVPALLAECVGDQAVVRRAAMRALGRLAQPSDLPTLAKGLFKSAPGNERDEAARALAAVCARASDPARQAEPLLALYREAGPADRLALLPVLGRLGGKGAFEIIRGALASADPATYEAGVAALSHWPDSDEAVEAELLALAQKADQPADRAAALRAYLRVIAQPSGASDLEKLKKFEKAMGLAERDDERALILERVAELRRIETVRFVLPFLDQPALASRAGNTLCDLARERSFVERHKAEVEQALNKVLTTCKDPGVLERAKRRLQAQ